MAAESKNKKKQKGLIEAGCERGKNGHVKIVKKNKMNKGKKSPKN